MKSKKNVKMFPNPSEMVFLPLFSEGVSATPHEKSKKNVKMFPNPSEMVFLPLFSEGVSATETISDSDCQFHEVAR